METNGTTVSVSDDDFILAICQTHADDTVVFTNRNGIDPIGTRTGILLQAGFLDDTVLRAEHHIMRTAEFRIVQVLDTQANIDSVIRVDIQHILNGTSLRVLGTFRYLIYFHPETATFLREEEHRVVHGCRVDILDEILIARCASPTSNTAASLSAEISQRCPLDIAKMADGDDNFVVGIEVLRIKLLT